MLTPRFTSFGLAVGIALAGAAWAQPLWVDFSNVPDKASDGAGGLAGPAPQQVLVTVPPDAVGTPYPSNGVNSGGTVDLDALASEYDLGRAPVAPSDPNVVRGDLLLSFASDPAGNAVHFETMSGAVGVRWTQIDFCNPPAGGAPVDDVDGLCIRSSAYFSETGDPGGASVWWSNPGGGAPWLARATIVGAVVANGYTGPTSAIDVDAMMLTDIGMWGAWDGPDTIVFSIRDTRPAGGSFDGGELIVLYGGGATAFLVHGGHTWDTAFNVAGTFGVGTEEVDAVDRATYPWNANFDDYAAGSGMHGVRGWKGWDDDPAFDALVTDAQARSVPNSVEIVGTSDLVHEFPGADSGQWTFTAWQYVPGDFQSGGTTYWGSYFILLNTYNDGGPYNWSVQLRADSYMNLMRRDGVAPAGLPLITDRWVEIRVEIDLDNDSYRVFYDGTELGVAESWTGGVYGGGGGVLSIGAVDLWANGSTSVYYDDFSLVSSEPPCPGDADGDGFVGFTDLAVLLAAYDADCDGNPPYNPAADFDGDGCVNFGDLAILLVAYGGPCP